MRAGTFYALLFGFFAAANLACGLGVAWRRESRSLACLNGGMALACSVFAFIAWLGR